MISNIPLLNTLNFISNQSKIKATKMNELIPEVKLRELSRTIGTLIPKQEAHLNDHDFQYCFLLVQLPRQSLPPFRDLQLTFGKILHTAGSRKLSISHGIAAWNCVHGFLDQGIGSSVPQIRDLFLAPRLWVEVFDLFLATGSNHKTKPMKQVIVTLAKVISQISEEKATASLASHVTASAVSMIHQSSGSFSMKLIFHVLDHFINKGIVGAPHLALQYAAQVLPQSGESTVSTRAETSWRDDSIELFQALEISQVEALISDILDWARYPDTSSITGTLLVTLCKSLRNYSSFKNDTHCSTPKPPFWAGPVKTALQREPFLLEIFGFCILPGLLRLHHSDAEFFLDTLPLKELQQGKALDISAVDIGLSLLTLRECMESRLITAHGMFSYL